MEQRQFDKLKKKEQLKNIIINKFRAKFGVRPQIDDLDAVIKQEVDNLLSGEQMTEASLLKLDKKIQSMVSNGG